MSDPNTTPAHQVGDIVNGHTLTRGEDGALSWVPVAQPVTDRPARKWYTKKRFIIPIAALLLIIIIGSINRPANSGETATVSTPDAQVLDAAKAAEKEEPAEPVKVTIPDVTGKTAAEATATLESAGFKVTPAENADWIVTETAPAKGGIAIEGAPITLVIEAPAPKLTLSQQNAVDKGASYLEFTAFSRSGLIGQLEYEGFTTEDSTFAVDFIAPDWNAQAAAKAKSYLDMTSFSREGLYDQLAFEGFSDAEINAGLAAVGY